MQFFRRNVRDCESYHRRDFLHVGAAPILGLGLSQILRAQANAQGIEHTRRKAKPVKSVIMIWLSGGPATIDMWDMKPYAPSQIRGEFQPIHTSADDIQICEHMPKLAKQFRHCCVVRSIHHTLAAHGPGTEFLFTGNKPSPALDYPSLGSIVSHEKPSVVGIPSFVRMGAATNGSRAGYLGAAHNPFQADVTGGQATRRPSPSQTVGLPDGFTVADLNRRSNLQRAFDQHLASIDSAPVTEQLGKFQQQAIDILRSNKTRVALDISKEDEKVREAYGFRGLGSRLLAARRLVEAGVQFVTIGMGGWDTHGNNFSALRTQLLPELDSALAALIADLAKRNLLDSTLVYCTGEFGRTPSINGGGGRDHWARAMSCLLAGGPVKRGFAYGSTGPQGFEPEEQPCSPMDISATVLEAIGISSQTMLTTRSGRPLAAISDGKSIRDILV